MKLWNWHGVLACSPSFPPGKTGNRSGSTTSISTTITNKTTVAQNFTDALGTTSEIAAYANAGDNNVGHLAKEWLAAVSHTPATLNAAQANLNSVLIALLNAAFPYSRDDDVIMLSADANVSDTIKWDGSFDNGKLTVINFGAINRLDFTAYGASCVFSATLVDNVAASQKWHGGIHLSAGCKYISLTRTDASTTEYKIELWTLQGRLLDAYGGSTFYVGPSSTEPEKADTAQLIGYVDLGFDLNATGPSLNIDL